MSQTVQEFTQTQMTVICAHHTNLFSIQDENAGQTILKPVVDTVNSQYKTKKQIRFNPRVRTRRVRVPSTKEECRTFWSTEMDLSQRRQKDKKLRKAIAQMPNVYTHQRLLPLGLYTEVERRLRYKRAWSVRRAVFAKQEEAMLQDDASEEYHSEDFGCLSTSTSANYALYTQVAASCAHARGVQHASHVSFLTDEVDEDASSKTSTSSEEMVEESRRDEQKCISPFMEDFLLGQSMLLQKADSASQVTTPAA